MRYEDRSKLKVGSKVQHRLFGAGIVTEIILAAKDQGDGEAAYMAIFSGGIQKCSMALTDFIESVEPKFKPGDRVATPCGFGVVEEYVVHTHDPHYKVRMENPLCKGGKYGGDLYAAVWERTMELAPYTPKKGDKVTWGSGQTGYTFQGTMTYGATVVTDGFDIGTGTPVYPAYRILPPGYLDGHPLRPVPSVKQKTVKLKVDIDIVKKGGKYVAYATSDQESLHGYAMPKRVANRTIEFDIEE